MRRWWVDPPLSDKECAMLDARRSQLPRGVTDQIDNFVWRSAQRRSGNSWTYGPRESGDEMSNPEDLAETARILAATADPPPAEIICDLDFMDYEMRGWGARYTLMGKKRRKAQLESAAALLDEGTPFIFDGRRIPGRNDARVGAGTEQKNAGSK